MVLVVSEKTNLMETDFPKSTYPNKAFAFFLGTALDATKLCTGVAKLNAKPAICSMKSRYF